MSNDANDLLKKIKANQPENLTETNDFLGTIPKGDMIKGFLNSLLDRGDTDIQMIALYGEWGSGKTSLMNYIREQLDKEDVFKTVFFPAWEMEKDDNLSLSLLESIIESEDGVDKTDIKEAFLAIGKGICKGLSEKIGPININFKEVMQSVEEYNKSITDDSALKRIKQFKEKYYELEDNILKVANHKKLITFIDDLDRCEPENVLNLLSAIKLFFTFGKRTIFIFGLDEKAVDAAVKVKYGEVIKSGEYMEKIFDISFNMPKPDVKKMITYYFNDNAINHPELLISEKDQVIIDGVHNFFEAMHFTNPRHIKKVLNKYLLLRYYQENGLDKDGLIPDQRIGFFRYLTLFIIMLYKFESDNFEILKDYESKFKFWKYSNEDVEGIDFFEYTNESLINVSVKGINDVNVDSLPINIENKQLTEYSVLSLRIITLFAPKIEDYCITRKELDYKGKRTLFLDEYCGQFVKKYEYGRTVYFCDFIYKNCECLLDKELSDSKYRLWNIFDMAERYL